MTTTTPDDAVREDEPIIVNREARKRLSTRVKDAGLWGPRAVKRFVVKHKKGLAYFITAVMMLSMALVAGWLLLSFYAWLLTFNPILFWLIIGTTAVAAVYLLYMTWYVWPRPATSVVSVPSEPVQAPTTTRGRPRTAPAPEEPAVV